MKKILAIIALLFLPTLAAADTEYVVRSESTGACYLGDAHQSPARVCGQCLEDAGDAVIRTFRVFCKGGDSDNFVETEKLVNVNSYCDSEQELKDDAWWLEEAEENMDKLLPFYGSFSQCDLDEWSWWSKNKAEILGIGFVIAAGLIFYAAEGDEGDKPKYTVKKKLGKSTECRSGHKRLKTGAEYCHNCKNSGGNTIARKYDVYCNGKPMGFRMESTLKCGRSIPDEDEQDDMLIEKVEEKLNKESAEWSGCEVR